MTIPGSNILSMALTALGRQAFDYRPFQKRDTNIIGMITNEYLATQALTGSVQPVPRSMYAQNGLDFQKNYVTFFVEANIIDIMRDVGGDVFIYNGKHFQALSKTDWFPMDGWVSILTVQVPNA